MTLVLACALCAAAPDMLSVASSAPIAPLEGGLSLGRIDDPRPGAAVPLALAPMEDHGAGDGDHSDHMGPMWILMGVMMAVMVVGIGVYLMRHSATGHAVGAAGLASPAQLALPVSISRGGGG